MFFCLILLLAEYMQVTKSSEMVCTRNFMKSRTCSKVEEPSGANIQTSENPRLKRQDGEAGDVIDPQYVNNKYLEHQFYGMRDDSVFLIQNKGEYKGYDLSLAFGVRLQNQLILTVCSAVSYVVNANYRVTYTHHPQNVVKVRKCTPSDITVQLMSNMGNPVEVRNIYLHPSCNNQLSVDIAVLLTKRDIPSSKNVWVHTAESVIFRQNLHRVIAAQTVLGKCAIPIYKKIQTTRDTVVKVSYARVHFQNWEGCLGNVCPYWNLTNDNVFVDENRCHNKHNGTRFCLSWWFPRKLCNLIQGTPVFCDVGEIHGLMGFLLRETYDCFGFTAKSAVMQGLNDAIPWIRETLTIRFSAGYEDSIPDWMKGLRYNISKMRKPKIRPIRTTPASLALSFDNFIGDQVYSIINVYVKDKFKCRGTLVTTNIAVMPCSCVTFNSLNMTIEANIIKSDRVGYIVVRDFSFSLMIDTSNFQTSFDSYLPHSKCDNHYMYDSALTLLSKPFRQYRKIAWIMTSRVDLFRQMLQITAVADSSMGHNCYWLNNESPTDRRTKYRKHKIRFVPWTHCMNTTCPSVNWRKYQTRRCYGPKTQDEEGPSLLCIETTNKKMPACDIVHGTPIFCNVEETRGFIGFVTKAMDISPIPCGERQMMDQLAVVQSVDNILPEIAEHLWIWTFENIYREVEAASRQPGTIYVTTWIIAICIIVSLKSTYFTFVVF